MRKLFKSIRFRITIVYVLILALMLSMFSVILYQYVKRSLYSNMDSLLQSKADGIVHAINSYWAAERLGSKRYGVKKEEALKDEDINFATVAEKWVGAKSKDPKLLDIIVQIFNLDSSLIASSKNTQGISGVSRKNFISALEGKSFFDTLVPSFPTKKLVQFRVFVTPAIQSDGKIEYVVQVASPLTSIQTTLYTMRVTLFILFPITLILTGVLGALLARITLRPVDEMIKTIHNITAENMKLRIAIPDTKDEIEELANTFNDMIERLDNAFTSQKQLFEDLSHDLKTPLTILKGEFEVVLKKARSSEEYESILKSSLEEMNKIIKLVDKLLLLASVESKKILPERKKLDLNLLIQSVLNNTKRLAEEKHMEISVSQPEEIAIMGDEQELKHLFLNLIDNAIKYTMPKGKIEISVEKTDSIARIAVKDTGIGIPQDRLNRIFDRFYRLEKSRAGEGFGLGLSIVKSIVDAHNGSIEVQSRLDRGTTFIVSLPHVI